MFKKLILSAGAAVVALAVAPAANAAIFIGISVNGGAITTVASDGGSGSASYSATTGGYQYNVFAAGAPAIAVGDLLTQSVNIRNLGASNATLDVYITQQDINMATAGLLSTLTSNTIAGATATLTSYYSDSNALYSGTQLRQGVFTGPGVVSGPNAISVTAPFSETVRYSLNFTGGAGSNFNGTANLAAVPEPTTWALFILGFGALGFAMRRRNAAIRSTKATFRFA